MLSRTHAAHCSTLRQCTTVVIGRGSQHKCTRSHAKMLVHKHVYPPKCRVHEQERRRPSFLPATACVRSCILRSEIQEIRDYNGSNFCSNKDLFISQWGHKTTIFDGCIEMHPSAATPLVACPTERDHASLITAVNTPNRRATTRVQIAPHYPLHSPYITIGLLVSSKINLVLNLIL